MSSCSQIFELFVLQRNRFIEILVIEKISFSNLLPLLDK